MGTRENRAEPEEILEFVPGVAAQVSLYPLRQPDLAPTINDALEIFRGHGLEVTPGSMSSMVQGSSVNVFEALKHAFEREAGSGEVVMVVTFSNACPVPASTMPAGLIIRSIGHVENEFKQPADPDTIRASASRVVIEPEFSGGLQGLSPGDRVWIVFQFHLAKGYELLQHPRGDQSRPQRGVFSLRSPRRPNPIGMTEVELQGIQDNILIVHGLDAFDGTPVIDLKPA